MTDRNPSAACACGSGLRQVRCCGLPVATLGAVPAAAKHLLPLVEQAAQAQRQGNVEHAAQLCLDVLDLAPGQTDALAILYRIRRNGGKEQAAETLLRRLVAVNPNIFWATNELTLLLMARGNLAEAELHARNAVRIAPEDPQAHNLMGMILTEAQRPQTSANTTIAKPCGSPAVAIRSCWPIWPGA